MMNDDDDGGDDGGRSVRSRVLVRTRLNMREENGDVAGTGSLGAQQHGSL